MNINTYIDIHYTYHYTYRYTLYISTYIMNIKTYRYTLNMNAYMRACTNALACMDVVCARACFARVTARADAPCPQFDNELPKRVLALRRRASRGGVRAHSAHMRARHACAHDQHAQSITSTRTGQQFHKQADTHTHNQRMNSSTHMNAYRLKSILTTTHALINPYERISSNRSYPYAIRTDQISRRSVVSNH